MTLRKTVFLILVTGWASFGRADDIRNSTPRNARHDDVVERLARRIEPDLAGRPERLRQYVDFFRSEIGNDYRLFAFDVAAKRNHSGQIELRGHIEFPETRAALTKYLSLLGFAVEDRLETLPSAALGEQIFGFVKASHSLSYDRPRGRRTVETDCLLGEPLYLLRETNGHLLVHSGEGYLGYVRDADVLRVDAAAFARYTQGPSVRMISDQPVGGELTVPAGARLKWISTNGETVHAMLPTRETVALAAASCEVRREPAAELDAIIENARQLLGTRYLWGGRTSNGVDCSGLVQIAYATAGLHLPRDSYQQFYVGQLTATRWHTAGLRRGDTLYFLGDDGKIRHTGLYLGGDRFLHAVSPVVRISSFNPEHEDYDARRHASFAFAKRLLD
ncbi:MAG: C40 family peptidase [Pirellulales bacterium]